MTALNGMRVIELAHERVAFAGKLLADMGADVIKVERPGAGDVTRSQLRDIPNVDALYFTMLNSNKRFKSKCLTPAISVL